MIIPCQWFLQCFNKPAGTARHPILGDVPICHRCLERMAAIDPDHPLEFTPYTTKEPNHESDT